VSEQIQAQTTSDAGKLVFLGLMRTFSVLVALSGVVILTIGMGVPQYTLYASDLLVILAVRGFVGYFVFWKATKWLWNKATYFQAK